MPDGNGFVNDLTRHIGQTVTIFTTSGGESGEGFTGILVAVNCRFVRLINQIGSAPGCALGNCCDEERRTDRRRGSEFNEFEFGSDENRNRDTETRRNTERNRNTNRNRSTDRFDCTGRTLGAIVDIPIDRIAAFVHNAVGSSGW